VIRPAAAALVASVLCAAAAAQPPRAAPDESDLVRLETALATDADDLRAGNDYRMAVIGLAQYDRALAFFEKLVADHPDASNAHLNYGFAYVDKIPVAGAITQVILANKALHEFSRALELRPTWIGYYTRGNSYLFWPKIFGRTRLGVADLEEALRRQRAEDRHAYYVRTYISLGDAYWIADHAQKAVETWREGIAEFPGNAVLAARLAANDEAIKAIIDTAYDYTLRVDTNLDDLWTR
jgi:tetratricopeptide (TPR) repeat protein